MTFELKELRVQEKRVSSSGLSESRVFRQLNAIRVQKDQKADHVAEAQRQIEREGRLGGEDQHRESWPPRRQIRSYSKYKGKPLKGFQKGNDRIQGFGGGGLGELLLFVCFVFVLNFCF